MTQKEKTQAEFTTSPYGAISKIPAGYTVEIRDLVVGTKFKIEEREHEIPKGYHLQEYKRGDGSYITEDVQEYNAGTIRDNADPEIEVHNKRGFGLTVNKEWPDNAFMESHDNIFFALYYNETLIPGTIRQLDTDEASSLYYYLAQLPAEASFDDIYVREVSITAPVIDSDGYVTAYDELTPVAENETIRLGGTEKGKKYAADSYTYHVTYNAGTPTGITNNIRTDTVRNERPGIQIIKTDWNGQPISGGKFTLQDTNAQDVGAVSYTADNTGLITTAYLERGRGIYHDGSPSSKWVCSSTRQRHYPS